MAIIDSAIAFYISPLSLAQIILEEAVLDIPIIVSELSKAVRNIILHASYIFSVHKMGYFA